MLAAEVTYMLCTLCPLLFRKIKGAQLVSGSSCLMPATGLGLSSAVFSKSLLHGVIKLPLLPGPAHVSPSAQDRGSRRSGHMDLQNAWV